MIKINDGKFVKNYHKDVRKYFLEYDNKVYLCKNNIDAIDKTKKNNIWILNEIIYYYFSKKLNFLMPEAMLLNYNGELHFASQFIEEATEADLSNKIGSINIIPLVACAILDLSLFNSDRYSHNILQDAYENIKFIDHDKAVFGNGTTDLHRFSNFTEKFDDYVCDYLPNKQLNSIVFKKEYKWLLNEELTIIISVLRSEKQNCLNFINSLDFWKTEKLTFSEITTYFNNIEEWWEKLLTYFSVFNFKSYNKFLTERRKLEV